MSTKKFFLVSLLFFCLSNGFLLFAQRPVLKFNANGKFKIVQFTDLHVRWQDKRSDIAFERMKQVLDDEKPDLVIFTGDIIYSAPAQANLQNVLRTVSDRGIPFSIVFGNHDHEQGTPKDSLLMVAQRLPGNLTIDEDPALFGVANYALPIQASDGDRVMSVLYCFDSNTYSQIKGIKGYDYIRADQIEWYRKRSREFTAGNDGEPLPSMAFFHIPLPEYHQAASSESAQMYGVRRERACSPELNSGLFTVMKENGDIMAIAVGHDHDNDYAVMWYDILLTYGRFTGGPTEYTHLPNGARVFELDEGARTFRTWIRTKAGVEQLTSYPGDYRK